MHHQSNRQRTPPSSQQGSVSKKRHRSEDNELESSSQATLTKALIHDLLDIAAKYTTVDASSHAVHDSPLPNEEGFSPENDKRLPLSIPDDVLIDDDTSWEKVYAYLCGNDNHTRVHATIQSQERGESVNLSHRILTLRRERPKDLAASLFHTTNTIINAPVQTVVNGPVRTVVNAPVQTVVAVVTVVNRTLIMDLHHAKACANDLRVHLVNASQLWADVCIVTTSVRIVALAHTKAVTVVPVVSKNSVNRIWEKVAQTDPCKTHNTDGQVGQGAAESVFVGTVTLGLIEKDALDIMLLKVLDSVLNRFLDS
ncbi:hypothetical protein HDU80_009991 [Chytriomyces hyalinus]|nr:hypothetical protein HDU80_009991 [Chytriomyces hyalinus]